MWAIFNTPSDSMFCGMNTPHRKLVPRANTFTIPVIAFLFVIRFPMKNAIDVEQNVNISELIIYIIECASVILFFIIIKLINTYIAHIATENRQFDNSSCLLYLL